MKRWLLTICMSLLSSCDDARAERQGPPWAPATTIGDLRTPTGFVRETVNGDTFGGWLRTVKLRTSDGPLLLHDGSPKPNQSAHFAILDIDVGPRNLQQCADAIMRLHAEYFFAKGRAKDVAFNFTSGHRVPFSRWAKGERPVVKGRQVVWQKNGRADSSYASFRQYLDKIFTYAGTASLAKELVSVSSPNDLRAGDVFIIGGFPGHAMLVVDTARNPETGKRVFMLAQSYMPAQEIHIVKNPMSQGLSPWFEVTHEGLVETPEWTFEWSQLERFPK
jgi:hypothetical protein